jgi:hypothetical protein
METFIKDILTNGGPSAVILGIGIWFVNGRIKDLKESVTEEIRALKKEKRSIDTCEATHEEVNRRFEHFDRIQNGSAG